MVHGWSRLGAAGVVCAEQAGEGCDGFEQQRVDLCLPGGGVLSVVAGDQPVPAGGGLVLVLGGLPAGVVAGRHQRSASERLAAGALRGGAGGAGACRGWLVAGELGDGFPGAGIVDQVLACGGGGHQRGGAGIVQGAGQAGGDPVQPGDRIIGEDGVLAAGSSA